MEKITHGILLYNGVPRPDRTEIDSSKGGEFVQLFFLEIGGKLKMTSIIIMNGKYILCRH
jgi:hypothetical protein